MLGEGMPGPGENMDAEIAELQAQGWDLETASADEAQKAEIESDTYYQYQSFKNPDGETYTILRKAPEEEMPEMALGEENPESIENAQRDKIQEVFPGLFGNPEDDNNQRAA